MHISDCLLVFFQPLPFAMTILKACRVCALVLFVWFNLISGNICLSNQIANSSGDKTRSTQVLKRWAIVALVRPGKSDNLNQRNTLLAEKLLPYSSQHNITVIFFSESTIPTSTVKSWSSTFKRVATVGLLDKYAK